MVQTPPMTTLTVLPYLELHGEFLMISWLRGKLPQYLAPSTSGLSQSHISNKEHPWNTLWREITLADYYFCLSTLSTQRNGQNYGSMVSHGQGLEVTLDGQSESHSVMSDPLWPHGLYSPWNSPGQNTGVGCHSLFQGIFPTQGSNPGLLHCRWILYQLSHQGSPRILEWVAYPFSRGSSQPRNQTRLSCIAGGLFTRWATREALWMVRGLVGAERVDSTRRGDKRRSGKKYMDGPLWMIIVCEKCFAPMRIYIKGHPQQRVPSVIK